MSESNVAERLKAFIEAKGLTYAQFADSCNIPRPSLSQLLTGRNKKVNDIMIGQIHNTFPELSVVWLLFGEGRMEASPTSPAEEERESDSEFDEGLFAFAKTDKNDRNKIIFSGNEQATSKISKETGLKGEEKLPKEFDIQLERYQKRIKELQSQIETLKKNPRRVDQITVYYDDSTFETFFPVPDSRK